MLKKKQPSWEVITRPFCLLCSFTLGTGFSFSLFEPNEFTQEDVRSENHQLQSRLKSVVSLERMKEALEQMDLDLAAAQKEAREKTKRAD